MNGIDVILLIIIGAVLVRAFAVCVRSHKKGGGCCGNCSECGGCCGEFEKSEKRIAVKDRNKSHYPYSVVLIIGGMTCENCTRRVENTLNSLDGVWAKVDLSSGTAKIYSKTERDTKELCSIIAKAGYNAELKNRE